MPSVDIIECVDPLALYQHYDGQAEAQPVYIELDLRAGGLSASSDGEIGNAVPFDVYHGLVRRYPIPVLTAAAVNRTMNTLAPLADRILDDWDETWDGQNMVAELGEDAQAAEDEILELLGAGVGDQADQFEAADIVAEWPLDGATTGSEVHDHAITAATTDERLDEIEEEILAALAECAGAQVAVCPELSQHLRALRDELE